MCMIFAGRSRVEVVIGGVIYITAKYHQRHAGPPLRRHPAVRYGISLRSFFDTSTASPSASFVFLSPSTHHCRRPCFDIIASFVCLLILVRLQPRSLCLFLSSCCSPCWTGAVKMATGGHMHNLTTLIKRYVGLILDFYGSGLCARIFCILPLHNSSLHP